MGKNLQNTRIHKGMSLVEIPEDYVVIDIETTGLDPKFNRIVEVSAIKYSHDQEVSRFSSLVQPGSYFYQYDDESYSDPEDYVLNGGEPIRYIDDFISSLTGITNKMLSTAPEIESVLPEFSSFISDSILIGHNVNFDINFLYDNFEKYLNHPLSNDFVDTMRLSRRLNKELKHHRLDDLISFYGFPERKEHRSLSDCEATVFCYQKIKESILSNYPDFNTFKVQSLAPPYDIKAIQPTSKDIDTENPFYGNCFVFTGTLDKMPRKEAMQLVVDRGGVLGNSVTKKTNFLVLGNLEYNPSLKGGKSSKVKKAEELILNGQPLRILSENVFYDMLDS